MSYALSSSVAKSMAPLSYSVLAVGAFSMKIRFLGFCSAEDAAALPERGNKTRPPVCILFTFGKEPWNGDIEAFDKGVTPISIGGVDCSKKQAGLPSNRHINL